MTSERKTVFILIGPKGSGKTYVGELVQQMLKIEFFRVEQFWLALGKTEFSDEFIERGFAKVEAEIDRRLMTVERLIMESTASFDYFRTFLRHLKSRYEVKLVRVHAPPDLCLDRIRSRDQRSHIPVSDHMVEQINQKAAQVRLDFDLEIDNSTLSDDQIVESFSRFLNRNS